MAGMMGFIWLRREDSNLQTFRLTGGRATVAPHRKLFIIINIINQKLQKSNP